jgi:hypothetical protein
MKISVVACVAAMFYLGLFPGALLTMTGKAVSVLAH